MNYKEFFRDLVVLIGFIWLWYLSSTPKSVGYSILLAAWVGGWIGYYGVRNERV